MFNKRSYYTLKDVIEKVEAWSSNYDTGFIAENENLFTQFLYAAGLQNLTDDQLGDIANKLWTVDFVGKYRDCFCVYSDKDELDEDDCYMFAIKYIHKFNDTFFKYNYMIETYGDNLEHLMDGIKVSSENKFNNTPQNIQGVYDWGNDDHLTNITKNESTTDLTTKMARIKEIQDNLRDLYSDWAEEFGGLFIYV